MFWINNGFEIVSLAFPAKVNGRRLKKAVRLGENNIFLEIRVFFYNGKWTDSNCYIWTIIVSIIKGNIKDKMKALWTI